MHSLTGMMAATETPVVDATLFAIEEVNRGGGVRGRPVEAFIADGQSDERVFARQAERLITENGVGTLFGCWTSASRKTVRDVVERHDGLLFYPVQFEGMEESPNIVYTGAAPNQQILPAVQWTFGFLRNRRYFLVGSDTVFSWAANAMVRDEVQILGGEIVGEAYVSPDGANIAEIVREIAQVEPDLIINSLGGELSIVYARALRAAGILPGRIPTLYFSVSELELKSLSPSDSVGDYGAWNYFQTIERPENKAFLQRFLDRATAPGASCPTPWKPPTWACTCGPRRPRRPTATAQAPCAIRSGTGASTRPRARSGSTRRACTRGRRCASGRWSPAVSSR